MLANGVEIFSLLTGIFEFIRKNVKKIKTGGLTHQKNQDMHLANRSSLMYQILTLLWALVILILSTMPGKQLPKIDWLMMPDKLGHAAVYGILTVGLFFSLLPYVNPAVRNRWYAFTLASLYGISLEVVQYAFFPGRYFEIWDIVANIIGAFAAIIFLKFINHS